MGRLDWYEDERNHTERMNILELREAIEDRLELLSESILGKFDLSEVESCIESLATDPSYHSKVLKVVSTSDSANLETRSDNSRSLPSSPR